LDRIIAQLAENHVVAWAASHIIIAKCGSEGGIGMIEQHNGADRHAAWIGLRSADRRDGTVSQVKGAAEQQSRKHAEIVSTTIDRGIVRRDHIVASAAIKPV